MVAGNLKPIELARIAIKNILTLIQNVVAASIAMFPAAAHQYRLQLLCSDWSAVPVSALSFGKVESV